MGLSAILLMTVNSKHKSRTYLFYGEAIKIKVLAISPIVLTKGGGDWGWELCASKLSPKRYGNLTAQRAFGRSFGFRLFEVLFANDLLDHIGEFLVETIWVFCRGVTPLGRTECSLDL